VIAGFTAFEVGNVAATLLILRATDLLTPDRGVHGATQIAIALYVVYNIAATITSFPAGGLSEKLGRRGPLLVTAAAVAAFLLAYGLFAISGPVIVLLGGAFALAGVGIGAAETAENAAVAAFAPDELRGSVFRLLATTQAIGNLAASAGRRTAVHGDHPHGRVHLPGGVDAHRARHARMGSRICPWSW
jgi:MFS family permease